MRILGRLVFLVLLVVTFGLPAPARAATGTFTDSFFKVKTFDPPLSLNDVFFLQPGDQPPLQMTAMHGKWVILNLWATWCAPCMVELPKLDALNAISVNNHDNFLVLAVSVDQKMDASRIAYYLKRAKAPGLAPLHDTVHILDRKLDTGLLPVTYIVDPLGRVRVGFYGAAEWNSEQAVNFTRNLIKHFPVTTR